MLHVNKNLEMGTGFTTALCQKICASLVGRLTYCSNESMVVKELRVLSTSAMNPFSSTTAMVFSLDANMHEGFNIRMNTWI